MGDAAANKVWVTCPICLSRGAVPASAIGSKVKCPKCTASFVAEPERPKDDLLDDDIALAPLDLPPSSGVKAVTTHDDEYNLVAEPIPHPMAGKRPPVAPAAPDAEPDYIVKPPKNAGVGWAFTSNVLTYPWTFAALVQWVVCSLFFIVAGTISLYAYAMLAQISWGSVVGVCVMVLGVIVSALAFSYASTCLLDITVNSAYNCDKLRDWPNQDWVERIIHMFRFIFLCSFAAIPAYALAEGCALGTGVFWPVFAAFMLGSFPLLLLSAFEADSYIWPFSGEIFGSVRPLSGAWIAFYLLSGLLVAAACVATVMMLAPLQYSTPLIAGPLWAAAVFIYGRLLGRLAWLILKRGDPLRKKPLKQADALLRGLP